MNKISIIIPIYNAESNLDKCLKSIHKQNYSEIEILCINDGSKDNSEKIIKKYCKTDNRFKLINKANTGVSDTRNCGIKKATGDYIMFIDADDYIDKDYIHKMVECVQKNNADIIISAYTEVKNNIIKQKTIHSENKNKYWDITFPIEIKNFLSTFEYNPCWKQLIKKDLLIKNNILFNTNIKYGEDMLFSFECYVKSTKTIYYKIFGYHYYINDDSVMSRKDVNSLNKHYIDNLNTAKILLDKFVISENDKQRLYYKTLKVYNKISWKSIYSTETYKSWKKNVNSARVLYKNIFKNYKTKYGKLTKDNVFITLLKYKIYMPYYVIQTVTRKLFKINKLK